MCAFDGFHVEVEGTGVGILTDCGVAGVCEGAGLAVTETGDVVFIAAEVLFFCGSMESVRTGVTCGSVEEVREGHTLI